MAVLGRGLALPPALALMLAAVLLAGGCATGTRVSAPSPGPTESRVPEQQAGVVEKGLASWYGHPYHGRQTASGSRYDMHEMTAAHRTLPFGTRVRVTNQNNGKQAVVVITDRGPFVEGRVIDLSLAGAEALDSVADGVVPVTLEVVQLGDGMRDVPCWEVQVGAFGRRESVARARSWLERRGYSVTLVPAGDGLTRVRVRGLDGRRQARETAGTLQDEFPGALAVPCGARE